MIANMLLKSQVNEILAPYNGYRSSQDIHRMYKELEAMGITISLMTNRKDVNDGWEAKATWYFDGEEIENSYLVYKVYRGKWYEKNNYIIYVS